LHFNGSDRALSAIVGKRYGEIDCEAQDHVFVAGESSDESAGLGCEGVAVVLVVGAAFGQSA
jgi:hypothetical protein